MITPSKRAKDWSDYSYGDVRVVEYLGPSLGRTRWLAECVCGLKIAVRTDYLVNQRGFHCRHKLNPTDPEVFKQKKRDTYVRSRGLYLVRASERRAIADKTPRYRFSKARANAKFRRLPWELTLEEYTKAIEPDCFYCDGNLGKTEKGTGLDRLDSNEGYLPGNVVSCCTMCNKIKGDSLTPEETKAAILAVLKIRMR